MNAPIWESFAAITAIVQVLLSHLAIGGGLYLVLIESWARRKNDTDYLIHVRRYSRFFVFSIFSFLITIAIGSWVELGLTHPAAIKSVYSNIVWLPVATVVVLVAHTAALINYYWRHKSNPGFHLLSGWICFITALLFLFLLNGVLCFRLTSSDWLSIGDVGNRLFESNFFQASLIFRTFLCFALAGLWATFGIAREKKTELKIRIMKFNGIIVLGSLLLGIPAGLVYFPVLPEAITSGPLGEGIVAIQVMLFSSAVLFLLTLLGSIIFPRRSGYVSAGILLFLGLLSLGAFEWARESIRKPLVTYGWLSYEDSPVDTVFDQTKLN